MAKCANCGRELSGNESFCPDCGWSVGRGKRESSIEELTETIKLMAFENRTQKEKIIQLLDNQNKMIAELGKMIASLFEMAGETLLCIKRCALFCTSLLLKCGYISDF